MRFILSFILMSAFSFAMQTCHKATTSTTTNTTSKTDVAKTDVAKSDVAKTNTTPAAAATKPDEHANQDDAPRITLADAKADFDSGRAIFVDTRPADAYKLEHVKGAINIPLADVDSRYKEISGGRKIIAYCS